MSQIESYLENIGLLVKENLRGDFNQEGRTTISGDYEAILSDRGQELVKIVNQSVSEAKGTFEEWFLQKSLPRTFIPENTESYKNFFVTGILGETQLNTSLIVMVNLKQNWILTKSGSIYKLGIPCTYRNDPYLSLFQ